MRRVIVLFERASIAIDRALAATWNFIKTVPGVRRVGAVLAHVTGLYALDRWLTLREARANLTLADHLDSAGLHSQAATLRESASEAITRIRRLQ